MVKENRKGLTVFQRKKYLFNLKEKWDTFQWFTKVYVLWTRIAYKKCALFIVFVLNF